MAPTCHGAQEKNVGNRRQSLYEIDVFSGRSPDPPDRNRHTNGHGLSRPPRVIREPVLTKTVPATQTFRPTGPVADVSRSVGSDRSPEGRRRGAKSDSGRECNGGHARKGAKTVPATHPFRPTGPVADVSRSVGSERSPGADEGQSRTVVANAMADTPVRARRPYPPHTHFVPQARWPMSHAVWEANAARGAQTCEAAMPRRGYCSASPCFSTLGMVRTTRKVEMAATTTISENLSQASNSR